MGHWSDRRVFITGASGLVGSALTRALVASGAYVVALIHDTDPHSELIRSRVIDRVHVVNGALEDYSVLERAVNEHDIDTVFHLGAQPLVQTAFRSPLPTFEVNVRGTWNMLEACRRLSSLVKAVVVASSDKAYGASADLPYVESMPVDGLYPYDVSKSCTDLIARSFAVTYGLPIVTARCGNIFGPGDLNWSRIVPGTIRSLVHGGRPVLRSDGRSIRDYIYVEDVVAAYLLLAETVAGSDVAGGVYNFSLDHPVSVLEIVGLIGDLMGQSDVEPIILGTATAEIDEQYLSSDKAKTELGWTPEFTLASGLEQTIDWYRRYFADHPET